MRVGGISQKHCCCHKITKSLHTTIIEQTIFNSFKGILNKNAHVQTLKPCFQQFLIFNKLHNNTNITKHYQIIVFPKPWTENCVFKIQTFAGTIVRK